MSIAEAKALDKFGFGQFFKAWMRGTGRDVSYTSVHAAAKRFPFELRNVAPFTPKSASLRRFY